MITRLLGIGLTVALAVSPVAVSAQVANPAATLSVAKSVRGAAPVQRADKAAGSGQVAAYIVGAALAVGFAVLVITNADNDRDRPDSN
jgi:hypothetical protein